MTTNTEVKTERRYVPAIGARVRLKTADAYFSYGLSPWTTLHVTGIEDNKRVVCIMSLTASGTRDGELVSVASMDVETPVGWKPRYTIHVTDDNLAAVLGWFRDGRGVAVLQSHYMPTCPTSFAPTDNYGTADWRFNGADVDVVAAGECDNVFEVVKVEHSTPSVNETCEYCNGTGKYTMPIDRTGFSHPHVTDCSCTDGKRPRYFSELDPKTRKAAVKQLEADGWSIWYEKRGRQWRMERETVVKAFGESVAPSEVKA